MSLSFAFTGRTRIRRETLGSRAQVDHLRRKRSTVPVGNSASQAVGAILNQASGASGFRSNSRLNCRLRRPAPPRRQPVGRRVRLFQLGVHAAGGDHVHERELPKVQFDAPVDGHPNARRQTDKAPVPTRPAPPICEHAPIRSWSSIFQSC